MYRSRKYLKHLVVAALVAAAVLPVASGTAAAVPKFPRTSPSSPQGFPPVSGGKVAVKAPIGAPPTPRTPVAARPAAWPMAATADVAQSALAAQTLPVKVRTAKEAPAKVHVQVDDQKAAAASGVSGLRFRVSRADGLKTGGTVPVDVDYSSFAGAYGADWAGRLRLVQLPACATVTPAKPECRTQTPVPSHNDTPKSTVSGQVPVSDTTAVFAITAGTASGDGDYKATPLTSTETWQVSPNAGAFSWSVPVSVPPVPGGLTPSLDLGYSSASVDGRTATKNNQTSWVGDGWDLSPGSITRTYKGCADDGNQTGDECWAGEDFVSMELGGKGNQLVLQNGVWRPAHDNGERVQHVTPASGTVTGDYWVITDTGGTQYWFGADQSRPGGGAVTNATLAVPVYGNNPGEPCYNGAGFAQSECSQPWKWNLDYVVDRHGDTMTYYYDKETNSYGANNGTTTLAYDRASALNHVDYGTRTDDPAGTAAAAQVFLTTGDRCLTSSCGTHDATNWPDTPWDRQCTANCGSSFGSPTFWTTKRLTGITTKVNGQAVDTWSLDDTYLDSTGTKSLWLKGITHTGNVGTAVSEPEITFDGVEYPNRLDTTADGLSALWRYRIYTIHNASGGDINVNYDATDCTAGSPPTPETNGQRCFPVTWTPDGALQSRTDWFVRYVVGSVKQVDRVGGSPDQVTSYDYEGPAAWHYDDNPLIPQTRRSWTQWRGYGTVEVLKGTGQDSDLQSATVYTYLRGMDGDRLNAAGGTKAVAVTDSGGVTTTDSEGLAGSQLEAAKLNGRINKIDGDVVSTTISRPYRKQTATGVGNRIAVLVRPAAQLTRTAVTGGWRTSEVDSTYDDNGFVKTKSDLGDLAVNQDETCTTYTYVGNTTTWVLGLPSEEQEVNVPCGTQSSLPANAVSDVRTFYDGHGLADAPGAGDVTLTQKALSYNGSTPVWAQQSKAAYDAYGRSTQTSDADNRQSTTAYTPARGIPTSTADTNALHQTETAALDVHRGLTVGKTDANGRTATLKYDGLGRLTDVNQPGQTPVHYDYTLRNDGSSAVATTKVNSVGSVTGYAIYDGFLRNRQTQAPSPTGTGRVLTDTVYDPRGLKVKTNAGYAATGTAGPDAYLADDTAVPSQTITTYDGAERPTVSTTKSLGRDQWHTTSSYHGDHTDVLPPAGGTATSTFTDVRGRTTELRQFHDPSGTGAADSTKYTYTPTGKVSSLTDAAGDVFKYGYDLGDNPNSADDPDKGHSTRVFDAAGQVMSQTDARGQTLAFVYDSLGRKTEEHRDSPSGSLLAQWTYDTATDTNGKIVVGELASSTRYVGTDQYTETMSNYDDAYRAKDTTLTIPAAQNGIAGSYKTHREFNTDGSLATERIPSMEPDGTSELMVYRYNSYGLLVQIQGDAMYVNSAIYTPTGKVSQITQGTQQTGNVWQSLYYDLPTDTQNRNLVEDAAIGSAALTDTTYAQDASGNVTKVEDKSADGTDTQCYGYDYLRRETDAWTSTTECAGGAGSSPGGPAPYWESFGYDVTGNRTGQTQHNLTDPTGGKDAVSTYTYNTPGVNAKQPHTVQSITTKTAGASSTSSYGYGPTGDTTSRPGVNGGAQQTLDWNDEDRLSAVTSGANKTSYVYDADGSLLLTVDPAGKTLQLAGAAVRYDNASKKLTGENDVKFGTTTVGVHIGGTVAYQVGDRQDTAMLRVDASSLTATRQRLDAFGQSRSAQPALPGSRGFVDGVADPTTGLSTLGVRAYDSTTGKFLSVDPMLSARDPQQINGFSYAENSPASTTDADGRFPARLLNDENNAQDLWAQRTVDGDYHPTALDYPTSWKKPNITQFLWPANPWRCTGGFFQAGCEQHNRDLKLAQEEAAAERALYAKAAAEVAERNAKAKADADAKAEADRRKNGGITMTCVGVGAQIFVGGSVSVCHGTDDRGPATVITAEGKAGVAFDFSASFSVKFSGLNHFEDLRGWGAGLEGGVEIGPVGVDWSAGASLDDHGLTPATVGVGHGLGASAGIVSGEFDYTWLLCRC
ncbi:RHS repeat-associated core domain-containing protein [Amycolatopsis sp. NPDC004378]